MKYMGTEMSDALSITKIYTILRPDLISSWPGKGEAHPFPEIFYLSQGHHWLQIDQTELELSAGQMVIYAPNSFHEAGTHRPENTVAGVLTFDTLSNILEPLYNRVITLNSDQKRMLDAIIDEGVDCFHYRAPQDDIRGMLLNEDVEPSTLWRLKKQIEFFLIDVHKTQTENFPPLKQHTAKWDAEYEAVVRFLRNHLTETLSLEQIAAECMMSVSKLKLLFRQKAHMGPINYMILLRINEAKKLIRLGNQSHTQIAESLGFSSLHYFSRQFKKVTGRSPSQYAKEI